MTETARRPAGGAAALAALWGLAEATLFFVVPDVFLSVVAMRRGLRAASLAALAAALGATLGGAAVILAARLGDARLAEAAMEALPAIDPALVAQVRRVYATDGLAAAFAGAFSGVPYKLYALAAGEAPGGALGFLAATPLIRLPRFLGAALVAHLAGRLLVPRVGTGGALAMLAAFWFAFYAWYWTAMPG